MIGLRGSRVVVLHPHARRHACDGVSPCVPWRPPHTLPLVRTWARLTWHGCRSPRLRDWRDTTKTIAFLSGTSVKYKTWSLKTRYFVLVVCLSVFGVRSFGGGGGVFVISACTSNCVALDQANRKCSCRSIKFTVYVVRLGVFFSRQREVLKPKLHNLCVTNTYTYI